MHDPNILSDHCLISFSFEFENELKTDSIADIYDAIGGKFVWKADDEFINRLNDDATTERLNLKHNVFSSSEPKAHKVRL